MVYWSHVLVEVLRCLKTTSGQSSSKKQFAEPNSSHHNGSEAASSGLVFHRQVSDGPQSIVSHLQVHLCTGDIAQVKCSQNTAVTWGPDLQNILRQSYDHAKVTIDLRQT